jgi:hypothetical protein
MKEGLDNLEKLYKCKICQEEFSSQPEGLKHYTEEHSEKDLYTGINNKQVRGI